MNSIRRSIDIFFLMRPVVLLPVWGFSIFGYWCGSGGAELSSMTMLWHRMSLQTFCCMVLFSLSVGAVYVLNQIADLKVDTHNDGTPLLMRTGIGQKTALVYALFLGVCACIAPLILGHIMIVYFSCATLLLGLVYSFRPCYFSGRPGIDFLSNAVGFGGIAFGVGWYLVMEDRSSGNAFITAALPYFLLMCGGSISSTLSDEKGDAAEGKKTTVVVLGKRYAHLLTIALVFSGGIIAYINNDAVAKILAATALSVDILYAVRPLPILMEATYKVTGSIAMLVAGIVYPVFLPVSAVVFFGTWLYFRVRFGIAYPSLAPVAHAQKN